MKTHRLRLWGCRHQNVRTEISNSDLQFWVLLSRYKDLSWWQGKQRTLGSGKTNVVTQHRFPLSCPRHPPGSWGLNGPVCLTLLKCPMASHSQGTQEASSLPVSCPTPRALLHAREGWPHFPGSLSCTCRSKMTTGVTQLSRAHEARAPHLHTVCNQERSEPASPPSPLPPQRTAQHESTPEASWSS